MAYGICPSCKLKRIAYSSPDPEEFPWTQWRCGHCGYLAEEDERQERGCPHCRSTTFGSLLIKDRQGFHRWCCACGSFEDTLDSFGR